MPEDDPLGELVPIGGGDSITLIRPIMTIGRRESNDICLKFANVSGLHCELSFKKGVWVIRDLGSQNGTKINGERMVSTMPKPLRPGDRIGISAHKFSIEYQLSPDSRITLEEMLTEEEDIFGQSLMEKAGLVKRRIGGDGDA
ncbi:MAG TPA: FHA domain-containing protein [Fimbriiglobus sp.]|jgi:adenylate cyclase